MLVDREGFREKTQPQDGVGRTSAKNKPKSILLRQAESSGKMQKWFVSLSSLFKSPYKVFCMSVLAGKKKKKKTRPTKACGWLRHCVEVTWSSG